MKKKPVKKTKRRMSPKQLAHLRKMHAAQSKKTKVKKPVKRAALAKTKPPVGKVFTQSSTAATKPAIPPHELPKTDAPGQTVMPVVEAAVVESRGVPHADIDPRPEPGSELL